MIKELFNKFKKLSIQASQTLKFQLNGASILKINNPFEVSPVGFSFRIFYIRKSKRVWPSKLMKWNFLVLFFELVRNLMSFSDNLVMVCMNMCLTWAQKIISAKRDKKNFKRTLKKNIYVQLITKEVKIINRKITRILPSTIIF